MKAGASRDLPREYIATEAGQFIVGAHRYISAARFLGFSDETQASGKLLQTPILHLLAHGIELLLKFPFISAGRTQGEVRSQFGHNLERLWDAPENSAIRRLCEQASINAMKHAITAELVDDDPSIYPPLLLDRGLRMLSHLHDRGSSFALRYTINGPTDAPASPFMIDAFGEVANDVMMDPDLVK